MKEQNTKTSEEPSHKKEEDKANNNKQKAKTSNQSEKTNQSGQTNQNTNSPDWLMHLLTGAGALGGNYLLFIKPLQEKFDAMNQAIIHHEKVIKDMQEQIEVLHHKIKKAKQKEEDKEEQNGDELFTTKRNDKPNPSLINGTKRTIRF